MQLKRLCAAAGAAVAFAVAPGFASAGATQFWQLAIAPDLNSPTFTRSMSWAWASIPSRSTTARG